MTKVVNQHGNTMQQVQEEVSQRQIDWNEVDREKQGVDSTDEVKYIE